MPSGNSKKPNQLITKILYLFFKPYLKIRYNFSFDNSAIKDLKGPAIILGNHASALDVFLMGVSAYPLSLNYVAGYGWFRYFGLGFILRRLKAIPKFQYQIDLISIKEMIAVIKQNQVLGLFPTGRLSTAGLGMAVDNNVAKLIKKLGVKVFFFRIDGAYLSMPKWAKHSRKGKIFAKYQLLASEQELLELSIEELTKKINNLIIYDDYLWNQNQRIDFKGKKLAENLEKVLFLCPKCLNEGFLRSQEDIIYCDCGLSLKLLINGSFEKNEYFNNPKEWNNFQKQKLINDFKEGKLSLLDEAKILRSNPISNKYQNFDEGYVTLIDKTLVFKARNERNNLNINLSTFPSLPFKAGHNFEVSKDDFIYKVILKKGNLAAKWSLAVEAIYEASNHGK